MAEYYNLSCYNGGCGAQVDTAAQLRKFPFWSASTREDTRSTDTTTPSKYKSTIEKTKRQRFLCHWCLPLLAMFAVRRHARPRGAIPPMLRFHDAHMLDDAPHVTRVYYFGRSDHSTGRQCRHSGTESKILLFDLVVVVTRRPE
jgi:hypothetical protein